jgi:hypothetical protein
MLFVVFLYGLFLALISPSSQSMSEWLRYQDQTSTGFISNAFYILKMIVVILVVYVTLIGNNYQKMDLILSGGITKKKMVLGKYLVLLYYAFVFTIMASLLFLIVSVYLVPYDFQIKVFEVLAHMSTFMMFYLMLSNVVILVSKKVYAGVFVTLYYIIMSLFTPLYVSYESFSLVDEILFLMSGDVLLYIPFRTIFYHGILIQFIVLIILVLLVFRAKMKEDIIT